MSFMDTPPADHGSDRFDYIEVYAPEGMIPPVELIEDSLVPCQDCRANVFIAWDVEHRRWHRTIAHDETCPALAAMEADGDL